MKALDIENKRRFWRRFLITGILVLVVALLVIAGGYVSGMAEASAASVDGSEMERDIVLMGARNRLLFSVGIWLLPAGILSSLMVNLARYRLRKLKKLENEVDYSH